MLEGMEWKGGGRGSPNHGSCREHGPAAAATEEGKSGWLVGSFALGKLLHSATPSAQGLVFTRLCLTPPPPLCHSTHPPPPQQRRQPTSAGLLPAQLPPVVANN